MKDDIYTRLGARLNRNPIKMPLVEATIAFLKEVFTEEQAELGAAFPMGTHSLTSLARELSRDEKDLQRILEDMADEGLILIVETSDGGKEYSLAPYIPGILEFQYLRGEDNDKVRRRTVLVNDMWAAAEAAIEELCRKADPAALAARPGTLRTIAIEQHLPGGTGIATWEKMSEILESETSFAAGACYCRQKAALNGHPCKLENLPPETCIFFGKVADFMVERKFARRFSREGVVQLLKDCETAGLIHNFNNFIGGGNTLLCNCCGCCCDIIAQMKKIKGYRGITGANFSAVVEPSACTACGRCIERCQISAIVMADQAAAVIPEQCLGCGLCVKTCPTGAITLRRSRDITPPQKDPKIIGLGY